MTTVGFSPANQQTSIDNPLQGLDVHQSTQQNKTGNARLTRLRRARGYTESSPVQDLGGDLGEEESGGNSSTNSPRTDPRNSPLASKASTAAILAALTTPKIFVDKVRVRIPIVGPTPSGDPVPQSGPGHWDEKTARGYTAHVGPPHPHSAPAARRKGHGLYIEAYQYLGSWICEAEFNPSTFRTELFYPTSPPSYNTFPHIQADASTTRDLITAVIDFIARQYVKPATDLNGIPVRLQRIDLSRDFSDVHNLGVLFHSLAPLSRRYTPKISRYNDPDGSGTRSLYVTSAGSHIKLYDMSRRHGTTDAARAELQLRNNWISGKLSGMPSLQYLDELTDANILAAFRDRWEWSKFGTAVTTPKTATSYALMNYSPTVAYRLVGMLQAADEGHRLQGDLTELNKLRDTMTMNADLNGTVRLSLAAGTEIFTPPPRKIRMRTR